MKKEKIIAFGKLLNRVKFQNTWNPETFATCASKTEGVSKSESIRFYKALVELGYLVKVGRSFKPTFDAKIWHDEDFRSNIIKNILDEYPIVQKRGRVRGKVYDKHVSTAIVVSKPVNPLDNFPSKNLVAELRNRGYIISCKKEITIVEEL